MLLDISIGIGLLVGSVIFDKIAKIIKAQQEIANSVDKNFKVIENRINELEDKLDEITDNVPQQSWNEGDFS